jgi:hypothetical protein
MNGKLVTNNNTLAVEYNNSEGVSNILPLHPYDQKTFSYNKQSPNIEFDIVDEFTHPNLFHNIGWGDGLKCAKIKTNPLNEKL